MLLTSLWTVIKMLAIKTNNLSKQYSGKAVVNNINLEIEEGQLISLLGVNGAGKTTVIKMLSCLTQPSSGNAIIYNHSIINDSYAIKEIINVSPQETAIAPNLTVYENLEFICGVYGYNNKDAKRKSLEIIDQFDLSTIAKQKASTLSGGWQRRLSIAMALITNPKILFLDEPTLGLDVLARRELWHFIESLKGKMTIILTTHYLEESVALSDKIAIMSKGQLVAQGTVEELIEQTQSQTFEDAFVLLCYKGGNLS